MAGDGMFGAIASGAGSGAGMGASVGSVIPGLGTAVGAAGGAIIGGVAAGIKNKKATDSQQIPLVDPLERARLAQLEQSRKNIMSGTDTLTQQSISQQQNIGKAAQTALSRVTGGDVGGTMDALLKSQKATQGGVNQAIGQSQTRLPYFDSAQGGLMSKISARKLQLQRLMRDQATAENAQARTDANVNSQALLATQGGIQTIPEGFGQLSDKIGGFLSGSGNGKALSGQVLANNKGAAPVNNYAPVGGVTSQPVDPRRRWSNQEWIDGAGKAIAQPSLNAEELLQQLPALPIGKFQRGAQGVVSGGDELMKNLPILPNAY